MVHCELVGILREVENHCYADNEGQREEVRPEKLDDYVSVETRKQIAAYFV